MANASKGQSRQPDWLDLFRCFRIACDPAKMWLGFLGAAFTILMLLLWLGLMLEVRQLADGTTSRLVLRHVREGNSAGAYQALRTGVAGTWTGLKGDLRAIRHSGLRSKLMETLRGATTLQRVIPWTVILLLLLSVPWAYFGGAIGRAAAVEYATGQRIATAEAREFAARRWSSYLWPPLALLLVLAALFLAGAVIGLAAAHLLSAAVFLLGVVASLYLLLLIKQKTRSGVTGALAGLLGLALTILLAALLWNVWPEEMDWVGRLAVVVCFPLLLALSITALLVLLVLLFGRGLMMSTISFEATDAFDGITRAGDYVLRRPWHLAFYTVLGGAYGIPCFAVVAFLAFGGFVVAALAVWAGFGQNFEGTYSAVFSPVRGTSLLQPFPGFLLRVLFALLCGLVAGWCASFIQSFRAICYALVRKSVDLSETSEVYLDISRVPAASPAPEGAGEENAPQPQP